MHRFFSSSTTGGLCVGKAATRPQISHIGAGGDGGANKEADAAASASSTAHQIVTASLIRSRASSIWPCRAAAESVSREREGGWEGGGEGWTACARGARRGGAGSYGREGGLGAAGGARGGDGRDHGGGPPAAGATRARLVAASGRRWAPTARLFTELAAAQARVYARDGSRALQYLVSLHVRHVVLASAAVAAAP